MSDANGRDLTCRDTSLSQPLEIIVVLEEGTLEPFIEKPHPIQDLAWRNPEGAVEAYWLDARLLQNEWTRHRAGYAKVVDVARHDPAVVGYQGHVIAPRKT